MRILIADDEGSLANFLFRGLKAEGYECQVVNQLHELLPNARKFKPEVIVLDRMFGDEDSVKELSNIKALSSAPMVLMLTALDEVKHRVEGLREGADDYLSKPFDFEELLARIETLNRRRDSGAVANTNSSNVISYKSLSLNTDERVASLADEELPLTKIEYDLLQYFIENSEKVLSRERILNRVWKSNSDPQTNIVDVYISRLRKHLPSEQGIEIKTLRGNGYRLTMTSEQ